MSRHTEAIINLAHFRSNHALAKRYAGGARILVVIKANGYGHGAVPLARCLGDEADAFGVATLEEAVALRDAGIQRPIVLMEGMFEAAEMATVVAHRLELVVHCSEQLDMLLAVPLPVRLRVWLKLDTGMHRLGFTPVAFRHAYERLRASANVGEIHLMSHLACADEPGHPFVVEQLARFDEGVAGLAGPVSLANSAALVSLPQARRDWVRPGIMLYGASPFSGVHTIAAELRPVMTLCSRLIAVRDVATGEGVGYGQIWRAPRASRIGTVAIGYGDGYPRHARVGTPVLVNGKPATLVGRVSMDMITLDISTIPDARVGDTVVLWGEGLPAEVVASSADTITYDLFTGIGRRVDFRYRD
ncbi:MAG: alanine racemase [Porticoccaceae bacterium]